MDARLLRDRPRKPAALEPADFRLVGSRSTPNLAVGWLARAEISSFLSGKPEETLVYVQKAKRLDPRHPEIGCLLAGYAYDAIGRYAQAVDALKQCEPNNPFPHVFLVFAYSELRPPTGGARRDRGGSARQHWVLSGKDAAEDAWK